MALSLVILAAGMGTRFGGDKPLAAVGPNGQSLFEYSIYDAFKAGFNHIVFVVNDQQDTLEISSRLGGFGDRIKIEFVVQDFACCVNNNLIDITNLSRKKPWGTAHAVLVCRDYITNPFVVINADDYYGRSNFEKIGSYLNEKKSKPLLYALPGYTLKNTLSSSGGVNRGICLVGTDGYLESIHEVKNIYLNRDSLVNINALIDHEAINHSSIVSMTFWGFNPSIFCLLENAFQTFLNESTDLVNDEFYIPDVVDQSIKSASARVKVFQTSEKWKGLTYAGDLVEVKEYISSLTQAGCYPEYRDGQNTGNCAC